VDGDASGWITIDFLRGVTLLAWRSRTRWVDTPSAPLSRQRNSGAYPPGRRTALRSWYFLDHPSRHVPRSPCGDHRRRTLDHAPWCYGALRVVSDPGVEWK